MPSVVFPREWSLLRAPSFGIVVSDVWLGPWTRRRALGHVAVFGGQTLFVADDDGLWIHSRALRPHRGKNFEGVANPPGENENEPVLASARHLRVEEQTAWAGRDERALVPFATTLHVLWNAPDLEFTAGGETIQEGGETPSGGWQWRAVDATSGETLASGVARPDSDAAADAPFRVEIAASLLGNDGRSLLFWVNADGVEKPYRWPFDYRSVTGETQARPERFAWTHPTRGVLHFDPRYRVGALPYDRNDPVQAALLDEYENLQSDGAVILRPEWAGYLILFNDDGSPVTQGGEYSCLKIQSGAAWVGDSLIPVKASAGVALWLADENGVLVPLMVEPRLRSVRAMLEDANGAFWVAGTVAGRNGRETALLRLDANWNVVESAFGDPFEGVPQTIDNPHSRTLLSACAGRAIYRRGGKIHVQTLAGEMRYNTRNGVLERVGVGGRSAVRLETRDGTELVAQVVDPDLALAHGFERFGARRGAGSAVEIGTQTPLAPLAKNLDAAICAKETFFGVINYQGQESVAPLDKTPLEERVSEDLDEFEDDVQGLARWTLGGTETLHWWKRAFFDMSRLVPWPKGVYAFGVDKNLSPRAFRLTLDGDGVLETGLSTPYLVMWGECGLTPDGQSETLRVSGKKFFGRQALPGYYAAEGSYGPRLGGVGAGGGPPQIDFLWDGEKFAIFRADVEGQGFDPQAFPPYIQWNGDGACWLACALAPVRQNGTPIVPYLVFDGSGDPIAFRLGAGVVLPQDADKWCGLRFTAGTCQGVVTRRVVPDPGCGPMDVAFVIDQSGSMGGAVQSVASELLQLRADIERVSGNNYRVSLVTFDYGIYVKTNFALNNWDAFQVEMKALESGTGLLQPLNHNYPEASDESLRTAIESLPASARPGGQQIGDFSGTWREEALKIAVLVTDDLPGGLVDAFIPGVSDENVYEIANAAKERGILISSVFTPSGSDAAQTTEIMENIAQIAGGLFVRTQNGGRGAGSALADVINSCGGGVEETFVEYCTDDVVLPVSCCSNAACVYDPSKRIGLFRVQSEGPMNAVWFSEKSNEIAFAQMCASEQRIWGRIDGTSLLSRSDGGPLSPSDWEILSEFNIPISASREFWLPRQGHTFDVVVILDAGVTLEADLAAVH